MEKDPIIFDHTGSPTKKEEDNADAHLPPGVQALIEVRLNTAIDKLRELNRADLKDLARKSKKPWQAWTAVWFVTSLILAFLMWWYTPKFIEDKVDAKLTLPAIEESADRIIEGKVATFIDDKLKPLNEQAVALGNKTEKMQVQLEGQAEKIKKISEEATSVLLEAQKAKGIFDSMRKYGDFARIAFDGSIFLGGGIGTNSNLTGWDGDFVELHKNRKAGTLQIKGAEMCTAAALDQYRSIVKKYPFWPFSHYILAICLKDQNDKSWENHASKAFEILEKTTAVPNHNSDHSLIMQEVKKLLQK